MSMLENQAQNVNEVLVQAPATSALTLREIMREHALLIGLVVVYWFFALTVSSSFHLPHKLWPSFWGYAALVFTPLVFAFCWHAISVMVFVRPDRLTRYLISSLRQHLTRDRVLFALPVLLLIPVFAATFTFFKMAIPIIEPYTWDARLTEWDRLAHGGIHPWEWLQPILGFPLVTGAINFLYSLWFFIMYAMLTLQAFALRNRRLRMQFLLSFIVCWIVLGTLGAIFFASMGPCYYPTFTQESGPYAPLMNYLRETGEVVPVWALNVQQMLWDDYQNNKAGIGSGISAMPSMHVATAVLLALFGWHYSRKAGIALTLYAFVIMIGSVHLGWHYALDGYVGALGAVFIWWMVGRLLGPPERPARID
jgi:hypothetical protein